MSWNVTVHDAWIWHDLIIKIAWTTHLASIARKNYSYVHIQGEPVIIGLKARMKTKEKKMNEQ